MKYLLSLALLASCSSKNSCNLPTTLSINAQLLGVGQGCSLAANEVEFVAKFGNINKETILSIGDVESLNLKLWLQFIKAQTELNDQLKYPREKVFSPSSIIYKSVGEVRSVPIMALLLASFACSDGAEAESYNAMIEESTQKNPEKTKELILQASAYADYAANEQGCGGLN